MTNTKPRLYFSDPIAALWMMRDFGVKIENWRNGDVESLQDYPSLAQAFSDLESFVRKHGKVYVADESEAIFEPKESDIGSAPDRGSPHTAIFRKGEDFIWEYGKIKIIMRDGKQFFSSIKEI